MIHKDFLGEEVSVGDYIFYSTTGRYAESRLCKITRFTPKSVFVKVLKHNRPGNTPDGEVVIRNDFVKVKLKDAEKYEELLDGVRHPH